MTASKFRSLALDLPGATEGAHMGHPDFRVRGRVFATLWPDGEFAMVKLTPAQQEAFAGAEPQVFEPVKGAWGRQGCTRVRLRAARAGSVREALAAAWGNVPRPPRRPSRSGL
jgi:hypothetical protein